MNCTKLHFDSGKLKTTTSYTIYNKHDKKDMYIELRSWYYIDIINIVCNSVHFTWKWDMFYKDFVNVIFCENAIAGILIWVYERYVLKHWKGHHGMLINLMAFWWFSVHLGKGYSRIIKKQQVYMGFVNEFCRYSKY